MIYRLLLAALLAVIAFSAIGQVTPGCAQGLVNRTYPSWSPAVDWNTGATWVVQRGYCPRDGGGSFYAFMAPNTSGIEKAGIILNGGLIGAQPGNESGDLDIGIIINGQYGAVISFTGPYANGVGLPGIQTSRGDYFYIGAPYATFREVHLTLVACPPSAPAMQCVRVSGGYVPIYR